VLENERESRSPADQVLGVDERARIVAGEDVTE
jgi:hypothetical protein